MIRRPSTSASIANSGVCLTVSIAATTERATGSEVDAAAETLAKTTVGLGTAVGRRQSDALKIGDGTSAAIS